MGTAAVVARTVVMHWCTVIRGASKVVIEVEDQPVSLRKERQ
jgi:hypothetical protein